MSSQGHIPSSPSPQDEPGIRYQTFTPSLAVGEMGPHSVVTMDEDSPGYCGAVRSLADSVHSCGSCILCCLTLPCTVPLALLAMRGAK